MRRTHLEHIARLVNRPDLAASEGLVLERTALGSIPGIDQEDVLIKRPEVMAMRTGISMADAEVAMAKKEYLPDFMIGAGIMDMMGPDARVMPVDNLGRRLGIEFGVVIPLQRGRRDAALDEARLRRRAYEARLEAVQTEIETELNDLQNRLREDEKALALYSDMLMPQAETTLASTMSAYTTGQADFLDLLDSRRMLLDLDMEYEETYADYLKTRAQLERTLGMHGDADVAVR
jgi:outer membrane protein TolC